MDVPQWLRMGARCVMASPLLLLLGAGFPSDAPAGEPLCDSPTTIFCDDFEAPSLDSWVDPNGGRFQRLTAERAHVFDGKQSLETLMPVGESGGHLTRWFMPGHDHLFVRLYVMFEPGWECEQNCQKIVAFYGNRVDDRWSGFGKAGTRPTGFDYFYAGLATLNWYRQPDPGEIILYSYFPDMVRAGDGRYWGNFFFQADPREAVQPGRWYCLELEVSANQPGYWDGFQRLWVDGAQKAEIRDMRWRDTDTLKINAVQLTFSGSVPKSKRVWIDNVVVSRAYSGCLDESAHRRSADGPSEPILHAPFQNDR